MLCRPSGHRPDALLWQPNLKDHHPDDRGRVENGQRSGPNHLGHAHRAPVPQLFREPMAANGRGLRHPARLKAAKPAPLQSLRAAIPRRHPDFHWQQLASQLGQPPGGPAHHGRDGQVRHGHRARVFRRGPGREPNQELHQRPASKSQHAHRAGWRNLVGLHVGRPAVLLCAVSALWRDATPGVYASALGQGRQD